MTNVYLWLDDIRDPKDWINCGDRLRNRVIWCHSVNEAIRTYCTWGNDLNDEDVRLVGISLDHDAGDYASEGGDYIKFLDWLEEHYPCDFSKITWEIHSMNPVGIENMERIIKKNGGYCVQRILVR